MATHMTPSQPRLDGFIFLTGFALCIPAANWLIGNAGSLSKGAVQLLRFIKNNSPSIDTSLVPLFDKAGL